MIRGRAVALTVAGAVLARGVPPAPVDLDDLAAHWVGEVDHAADSVVPRGHELRSKRTDLVAEAQASEGSLDDRLMRWVLVEQDGQQEAASARALSTSAGQGVGGCRERGRRQAAIEEELFADPSDPAEPHELGQVEEGAFGGGHTHSVDRHHVRGR